MKFKSLGPSSILLPEIGLGTWKYVGGAEPLRAAIDHGACLIDTAEIYGTEEVVGRAVRGRRHQVFIATKVAPRHFRQRDLIAAAENSLKRLGTDFIDLYQLHWPNDTVPIQETMAAMEDLVGAGKVRYIGVSSFSISELKEAQAATSKYRIVSNQLRYNLIDRTIETGLLEYCQQNAITVIAYSPLGSGLPRIRAADHEGVLSHLAETCGKTEVQIALNWLIAKERVLAIPKASTVAHAVEDCNASGWRLAPAQYTLLEEKIRCRRRGWLLSKMARCKRRFAQSLGRHV
jgi:diketogulonate reductase-like aldo/keto reductase